MQDKDNKLYLGCVVSTYTLIRSHSAANVFALDLSSSMEVMLAKLVRSVPKIKDSTNSGHIINSLLIALEVCLFDTEPATREIRISRVSITTNLLYNGKYALRHEERDGQMV
jgi:hypothetical protein